MSRWDVPALRVRPAGTARAMVRMNRTKCVDADPSRMEGGYSPVTDTDVPPGRGPGNAAGAELGYLKIDIDAKAYTDLGPVEAAAKRITTKA